MKTQLSRFIVLELVAAKAFAQVLQYTTAIVTTCYSEGAEPTASSEPLPSNGGVYCVMPQWPGGDCMRCAMTSIYTADFDVFCPTGTTRMHYTVTEIYNGMSNLPTFASPTCVPYAFTTGVHTCTVCGTAPITATMTYPTASHPFSSGMPVPDSCLPTATSGPGSGQNPGQGQGQNPGQGQGQNKPGQTGGGGSKPGPAGPSKSLVTVSRAGRQVPPAWETMAVFFLVPAFLAFWASL